VFQVFHHHSLHRSGRHCHTPVLEGNPVSADARRLQLCVVLRNVKDQKLPPASITHRGGYRALLLEHLPLFTPGKKYRVAMFLATSCTEMTAYVFLVSTYTHSSSILPPSTQCFLCYTSTAPSFTSYIPSSSGTTSLTWEKSKTLVPGSSTWTLLVRAQSNEEMQAYQLVNSSNVDGEEEFLFAP